MSVCVFVFPTGYSVLSATVPSTAREKQYLYISGAPRYNLTGGVLVFDAANHKQRQLLQGEQVGQNRINHVCDADAIVHIEKRSLILLCSPVISFLHMFSWGRTLGQCCVLWTLIKMERQTTYLLGRRSTTRRERREKCFYTSCWER